MFLSFGNGRPGKIGGLGEYFFEDSLFLLSGRRPFHFLSVSSLDFLTLGGESNEFRFRLDPFSPYPSFPFGLYFRCLGAQVSGDGKGKGGKDPALVSNHQIFWPPYEKLETKGRVDYYRFSAESGEEFHASLLVPKIDRLSGFSPDLALIGPGLEGEDENMAGAG